MTSDGSARPDRDLHDDSRPAGPDDLAGVAGRFEQWQIEYADALGSTNAAAAASPRAGRVVVTGHQTGGRGRMGRTWETPAGEALTFSAVVDPRLPDPDWPWVPLITGLCVVSALESLGVEATLKWPNDVLVEGKKIAGILIERVQGPHGPLAVIGIGLNVHQRELPVPAATSLALCGVPAGRVEVLRLVLNRLATLGLFAAEHLDDYRHRYRAACATIGQQVRVHLPDASVHTGLAERVDDRGCLVVSDGDDELVVGAGDVVHVRPAHPHPSQ